MSMCPRPQVRVKYKTIPSLVTEEATASDDGVPEDDFDKTPDDETSLPRNERGHATHPRRDRGFQSVYYNSKKSSSFHCANAGSGGSRHGEYEPKKSSFSHGTTSTKRGSFSGTNTDGNDATTKRDDRPAKAGAPLGQ